MDIRQIDFSINLDQPALKVRGGEAAIIDEQVKLLARENRLGLAVLESREYAEANRRARYLSMRCVGTAHPECQIRWLYLAIRFPDGKGIRVEDLAPEEVKSEEPVKITTSYSGGFSLEVLKVKLTPEANIERTTETQAYFSAVRGAGKGFGYANWTFSAPDGLELYVNRDLTLLVSYPPELEELSATFTLRYRVAVRGFPGLIPLIGRKTSKIEVQRSW